MSIHEKIWHELGNLDNLGKMVDIFIEFNKVLANDGISIEHDFLTKIPLFEISVEYLLEITTYALTIDLVIKFLHGVDGLVIPKRMYENACKAVTFSHEYYYRQYQRYYYEENLELDDVRELFEPRINKFLTLCKIVISMYEDYNEL